MSIFCIVIAGMLCVPPDIVGSLDVNHMQTGLSGGVAIKTDNWTIEQTLNSDCSGCDPDKTQYTQVCANGECVSYYRHCDDAGHPTACEYYFDKYPPIDVLAKTEADFQEAVATVGLVAANSRSANFLLSAFSREAPGPHRYPPPTNYMRAPTPKGDSK